MSKATRPKGAGGLTLKTSQLPDQGQKGSGCMDTAKSILAEKLAKGEISPEEYDRITSKLGPEPAPHDVKDAGSEISKKPKSRSYRVPIVAGVAVLAALGYFSERSSSASGLMFTDVSVYDFGRISFNVINSSDRTADAVFWLSVYGKAYCPLIFNVRAKSKGSVVLLCDGAPDQFDSKWGWASSYPDIEQAARRTNLH